MRRNARASIIADCAIARQSAGHGRIALHQRRRLDAEMGSITQMLTEKSNNTRARDLV